ncbi:hypothetical protein KIP69_11130 [Geobacter sulfurreducens]|uniref:Uncharacterized protein n=1 Tax=Geobacter sulfurreducens (strain ATCC 51573 / DSM 12127 / PCA) TaxID=243231 RepID=Q74AQ4_GEOSL|nr:hypothetical protein [Geobacter sulfurreducens]AAR35674.2 hypothetical protein GSU2298 [Geobacter sulfurreducens PCA]AJY68526.1 hypothetical protein RW64_02425 [Geobacter sulfurreducens]QVW34148.1 hypothetical protein KIP69_11130 [Geobacter sulfurreducens]UAC03008.1 hypothetical protein KVP06_11555 [Geobacter sulfurreducens]UTG91656.1 hypothetical protein J8622_11525 [Geobacter sulfurreducens]
MKRRVLVVACTAILLGRGAEGNASEAAVVPPASLTCEESLERRQKLVEELQALQVRLEQKIREMECSPTVSSDELLAKNVRHLQDLSANTRAQRQSMADFEKFVTWMSSSLAGYEKYIQAGSVVAGFARVLPIPYAGQASVLTKFVSQGVLSLNAASGSIASYLKTSDRYLAMVDAIDPVRPDAVKVSAAARYADGELLRAMTDVQAKLRTSADVSASTLSFLETLDHYAGNTDEYWAKTKAFVTRNDAYKNDKSYLAASIEGLRNRAASFNGRLRLFEESAKKDLPLIKNLVAYDDLIRELDRKRASGDGGGAAAQAVK